MKLMKLGLIAALALGGLLAGSTMASAQETNAGPAAGAPKQGKRSFPTPEQQLARMKEQLSLTDEQTPKVKAALEEAAKSQQEIRNDTSLSPDDRRAKSRALMDEQNKKLKEILTPEQYEKYQTSRGKRGPGPGGPGGPAPEKKADAKQ